MIVEDERDDNIFDHGFDYQGDNVEPCIKNRPRLISSVSSIVSCVIGTLIRLFKMTWLNMSGSILATDRCIGSFYVHSKQFRFGCKTIFIRDNFSWVVKLF